MAAAEIAAQLRAEEQAAQAGGSQDAAWAAERTAQANREAAARARANATAAAETTDAEVELLESLASESLGNFAVGARHAAETIGEVLQAEDGLEEAISHIEASTAQTSHSHSAQLPKDTLSAERRRANLMLGTFNERRQERVREARMWDEARRNGTPLPAVSVHCVENVKDPSRIIGKGGKSLVKNDELGAFISLVDGDNKPTMEYLQEAAARGARFIRDTDGKYFRNAFGVAVAYKIEESAAHLAHINEQYFNEDNLAREDRQTNVSLGDGIFSRDIAESEAKFLEEHMEDTGAPGRRPVVGQNPLTASRAMVPGRPMHWQDPDAAGSDNIERLGVGVGK